MRNIISLAHISLDGFMADPAGRFDFVAFNDELADHTYPLMGSVDLAVYGRVTYQMMESYWPTAGDAPDASAHAELRALVQRGEEDCRVADAGGAKEPERPRGRR